MAARHIPGRTFLGKVGLGAAGAGVAFYGPRKTIEYTPARPTGPFSSASPPAGLARPETTRVGGLSASA